MEKYIITGGPGVGKTTLLNSLSQKGFITIPEAARKVIEEESRKDRGILPWTDLASFQMLVTNKQLHQENDLQDHKGRKIFLDRGIVDNIAYAELGKVSLREDFHDLIGQAGYKKVFYLEQLPFYEKDEQRKEDLESAKKLHQKMYEVYDRLGFDIIRVPVFHPEAEANVEARVRLILREANAVKNREIERKYRVGHSQVKEMLDRYVVKHVGTDNEENTLYDFADVLKDLGCTFRIRQNNGEGILTVKGPSKSADFTNKPEYNFSIPGTVSTALDAILPESVSYSKRRENYRPLGDAKCTISLDYLLQLGEFVEIEAASENQVLLWERRLGISEYIVNKSYPALVRENGGR